MAQTIEKGSSAPAFELPNQAGERVSLESKRGKWVVLYFYPKDDTPGCTTQACDFTANVERLRALGAEVVGVSADSPESHRKFIAKHSLGIELLSDADRSVMDAYGAWGEKTMYGKKTVGVRRSTVLIDPQGRVAHHFPSVKAAGHAEKVTEWLETQTRGATPATRATRAAEPVESAKVAGTTNGASRVPTTPASDPPNRKGPARDPDEKAPVREPPAKKKGPVREPEKKAPAREPEKKKPPAKAAKAARPKTATGSLTKSAPSKGGLRAR